MSLEVMRLHLADLRGVDGLTWPVHGFVVTFPGGAALVDTGVGGPQRWLDDWRGGDHPAADGLHDLAMTPRPHRLFIHTHPPFDHCRPKAEFQPAPFYSHPAQLDPPPLHAPPP